MIRHNHFIHTHLAKHIATLFCLLLMLTSCGATPTAQGTTATPTTPRATPTPNIPVRSTSLLTYTGHSDGVVGFAISRAMNCALDTVNVVPTMIFTVGVLQQKSYRFSL